MKNKWKCSVCHFVTESEDPPKECPECKTGSHKFKPLYKVLKKRFELMD